MKKIIVVEDQAVLATIYRTKLTSEGFQVEVATDGEQGLELIKLTKPDLVLLDLMLPKLNGIDVLRTLRSIPGFQTLPIIIFSNSGGASRTDEAWKAGATMVLSKSTHSPKQLIESVRTALAVASESESMTIVPINPPAAVLAAEQFPNDKLAKGHVLLVEDHGDTRALLAFILDRAGHWVTTVESQAAALRQVTLENFDLFLLNRVNPDGSGLLLCQQLRQSYPNTPVVIYSTAALPSEQREGIRMGAAEYLVKAEDLYNLGQIASELVSRATKQSQLHSEAA